MTGQLEPGTAPPVPRPTRGIEVKAVLAMEREGRPFLVVRPPDGDLALVTLDGERQATVGRDERCALAVTWDDRVSRTHADLIAAGAEWTIADDGLSRNGTFVNDVRVTGRRRLVDQDVIRVGQTLIVFRDPVNARAAGGTTRVVTKDETAKAALTPAQRRVLIALCRPMAHDPHVGPASNAEIGEELVLSIAAVKTHIRALFALLGTEDLPQSRKRARLAQVAFERGLVSTRDLVSRAD